MALPCRELALNDDVRRRAGALAADYPDLAEMLDAVAYGRAVGVGGVFVRGLRQRLRY